MADEMTGGEPRSDRTDGHVDVVALALGDADGAQRSSMAAHLLGCRTCREEYDELTATVGDVLATTPAVQPPLGFDERVVAALRRTAPASPQGFRLRRVVLAAAVISLVVGSFALGRSSGDQPARAEAIRPLELTSGTAQVGSVSLSDLGGRTVMVVAVVGAPPGASYRCRTTLADGTLVESPPWPAGDGAWLVPLPGASLDDVRTVTLVVDGTGDAWSSATFSDAA